MTLQLDAFPKISRKLIAKIGYMPSEYKFYYKKFGEVHDLNSDTTDTSTSRASVLKLTDESAQWHPEDYELNINMECRINVPKFLFGENGLAAAEGGVVGLAVMWMDPDASIRGVIPIGDIKSDDIEPHTYQNELTFPRKTLRGTLILQVVLYLKERGKPEGNEKFQANESGTILGVLDETRIIIDGNGSMFPIHEVYVPTNPLWWVRCSWEDATEDKFDDNFCVMLNKAHKNFASLNVNEGLKNSPLLIEIVSSSLVLLVSNVMSDDIAKHAVISGTDMMPGSVASVVNYLMNRYQWHFDDLLKHPEQLSLEVHKSINEIL